MSEMELKILGVIKENSGFSRNEIAETLGRITFDGVKYRLSNMEKELENENPGWKAFMELRSQAREVKLFALMLSGCLSA